jgi:octaprenyl-diphosphate synthase
MKNSLKKRSIDKYVSSFQRMFHSKVAKRDVSILGLSCYKNQGNAMSLQPIEISSPSTIEEVKSLVCEEFQAMDHLIKDQLYTTVPIISDISNRMLESGGKRLRPLIVLLVAKAFDNIRDEHISLAAVIEFLHTATLLHDDVVDNSSLRRSQQTANVIWGNAVSVLVGDFIYSRTFQILTNLKNIEAMKVLAKATNAIAEGEVLQLMKRNDPTTNEDDYIQVITNKTARLFEAAAEVAALVSLRSKQEQQQMAEYGRHLGIAFQLMDDALDFIGSPDELGKNIGDDLAEGKPTLPLIHAMQHASKEKAAVIRTAIQTGGLDHLEIILEAINEANSLAYIIKKAEQEISLALDALSFLPMTPYRQGLEIIANFSTHRRK